MLLATSASGSGSPSYELVNSTPQWPSASALSFQALGMSLARVWLASISRPVTVREAASAAGVGYHEQQRGSVSSCHFLLCCCLVRFVGQLLPHTSASTSSSTPLPPALAIDRHRVVGVDCANVPCPAVPHCAELQRVPAPLLHTPDSASSSAGQQQRRQSSAAAGLMHLPRTQLPGARSAHAGIQTQPLTRWCPA